MNRNVFFFTLSFHHVYSPCAQRQEAHRWRRGRGHPRTSIFDPFWQQGDRFTGGIDEAASSANPCTRTAIDPFTTESIPASTPLRSATATTSTNSRLGAPTSTTRDAAPIGPAVFPFPPHTSAAAVADASRNTNQMHTPSVAESAPNVWPEGGTVFGPCSNQHPTVPQAWVPTSVRPAIGLGRGAGAGARSQTRTGTVPVLGAMDRGAPMTTSGADGGTQVESNRGMRTSDTGTGKVWVANSR